MLDVPLSVKLEEWRQKAAAGTITTEEMRACIQAIRQGRVAAAATSAKSRASKALPDLSTLEDEINNL